jgi:hypothetical protein
MKIILTYEYSHLDNNHQFGLEFKDAEYCDVYIYWIWFYLGSLLSEIVNHGHDIRLYPFESGNVIKEYKFCNNAERQAKLIANRILKLKNK